MGNKVDKGEKIETRKNRDPHLPHHFSKHRSETVSEPVRRLQDVYCGCRSQHTTWQRWNAVRFRTATLCVCLICPSWPLGSLGKRRATVQRGTLSKGRSRRLARTAPVAQVLVALTVTWTLRAITITRSEDTWLRLDVTATSILHVC
jgi:hypothetical protein